MFTSADLTTIRNLISIAAIIFVALYTISRLNPQGPDQTTTGTKGMEDFLHFGATLISDGYAYFPDWSAIMIREFDNPVESHLESLHAMAETIATHPRSEWPRLVNELLAADSGSNES